ncbi:subclass B3 metallo-beta-lactamase [Tsuneonella suprasediminis]|uniref:Subclass B3 metallo-beta-lactamase n=1 Tax=Tsuneonella suprasediminis TaxID=2306996 RepID=A0A419QZ99_9SPHN|nr:subclass B3 metallo-beta-lactamase [Tsuneonella suprasediminis]RJX66320.1 subclass B3 metallo-beta-lactamase [Tsuneonella suprasediminis]
MFARFVSLGVASIALVSAVSVAPISARAVSSNEGVQAVTPWDSTGQREWAATCKDWDNWDKPGPPFRIYGKTYYVGTCGIAAILIAGDEGNILIDSGTRPGADIVAANIVKLGFRLEDVKLLLTSHEHFDHVGGMAELQRRTGARLLTSTAAKPVMESGKASPDDPQSGMHEPFESAKVDGIVEDGKPIRLGSLTLTPLATPGHTPGALSWQWQTCDGAQYATLVFADSLSAISSDDYRFSDHPGYIRAFRDGLTRVASVDCGILLTPHPSASKMRERFAKGTPFGALSCEAYAKSAAARLDKRLEKEASQ